MTKAQLANAEKRIDLITELLDLIDEDEFLYDTLVNELESIECDLKEDTVKTNRTQLKVVRS